MKGIRIFAQLTKVDAEKRLVYGRAASEEVDKAGEVFDYASSKPHFVKWSADIAADTEGKSLGNVRAMHGKVAAGKLTDIDFNDADKAIDVCAKVVDDNEWNKVLEGVYTGFSIGGQYVGDKKTEKMDGKDVQRYTATPTEISLVDRPCMPTAKFFDVIKHDGAGKEVHLMKVAFIERDEEAADLLDKVEEAKAAKAAAPKDAQAAVVEGGGKKSGKKDKAAAEDEARQEEVKEKGTLPNKGSEGNSVDADAGQEKKADNPTMVKYLSDRKDADKDAIAKFSDADLKKHYDAALEADKVAKAEQEEVPVKGSPDDVLALAKLMNSANLDAGTVVKIVADAVEFAKADTVAVEVMPLTTSGLAKYLVEKKDDIAKLVKSDFATVDRQALADAGKALPDGSFPIVTKADVYPALKALEKAKDVDGAKKHLTARASALGCTDLLPKDWAVKAVSADLQKMLGEGVVKGMYDVAQLVSVVQSLYGLCKNAWYERESERDDSMVPDRLKESVEQLVGVLKSMVDEESAELIACIDPMDKVDSVGLFARLAKSGARYSKEGTDRVQKVHDMACDLGAGCAGHSGSAAGVEKVEGGVTMDKATGNAFEKMLNAAVEKATAPLIARVSAAEAQVKKLEDQPAPSTVVLRAVAKNGDLGSGGEKTGASPREVAPVMKGNEVDAGATGIKKIHAQGGTTVLKIGQ